MNYAESQQGERKVSSITGHHGQAHHRHLVLSFMLVRVFVSQNYKKITKNKYKKKAIANVGESMANIEFLTAARNVNLHVHYGRATEILQKCI